MLFLSCNMAKDRCYKKVKKTYKKFPSARASQAIAKCRKKSGKVTKSKKGAALKRWQKEKWVNVKTGKPCGSGGKTPYCRPTKKVSSKTPVTRKELTRKTLKKKVAEKKKVGMGKRVSSIKRKTVRKK